MSEPPSPGTGRNANVLVDRFKRLLQHRPLRLALLSLAGLTVLVALLTGVAASVLYRQLPGIDMLSDYRPKQPLRVYTADGVEIGQFGTERRVVVPIAEIPKLMQDAVLAIEDRRFREHSGVDVRGLLRAAWANVGHERSQGGSTITQQVARTFYLSSRKTYIRKINEMLLALKIESQLDKNQILELYMNQIFLGQRAYGFEAAARTYFGKPMTALSTGEAAMLAGLPQNPAYANPVTDLQRARQRQHLVLASMFEAGVITQEQLDAAKAEPLQIRKGQEVALHAEHVAEMARQMVFAQHGEKAYTLGLKVVTTLRVADQEAAWRALRKGLLDFELRQPYRGPEDEEALPDSAAAGDASVARALAEQRDDEDLRVALVTEASAREVVATLASGEVVRINGEGLKLAQAALSAKAKIGLRIRRGSVIRVMQSSGPGALKWRIAQWPEVEGALVALDPQSGHVRALVGGFDFSRNKFNHASQAWRQPGSSFKPFLYSAALEAGVMPSTLINDAPLEPDAAASAAGTPPWDPKNSDDQFDGPLTLRQALAKSKNLVTIRLVQLLGPGPAREWASRFGFQVDKQPDNLTLALGSGATTPLQLGGAYAVLANGGLRVDPVVIKLITDMHGNVLFEAPARTPNEADRVLPARNAFITGSLLQEVTRSGTAARAQALLRRPDLYGKTGTTNDAVDAWFAGYQPGLVAVVWMGYDTPRSLGARESGGGLALPVWIDYMRPALQGVRVSRAVAPQGLSQIDGEWIYSEWANGGQVERIGLDDPPPLELPPPEAGPPPADDATREDGRP
jgi:penicillin-binding protein 1A